MLLVFLSTLQEKKEEIVMNFIDCVNRDLQDISSNVHLEPHAKGYALYDLELMLGTFDSTIQLFTPVDGIDLTDQHTWAVVAVMRHRDDVPLTMQGRLLKELRNNFENRFDVIEKNNIEYIVDCDENVIARVDGDAGEYAINAVALHDEAQTVAYLTQDILTACF